MIKNTTKNRIRQKNQKSGYVLVTTLIIMSVMLVMVYYSSSILFAEIAIARNQKSASIALNLAEAGVQEAAWQLKYDNGTKDKFINSNNGQTDIPAKSLLAGGSYFVNITNTDFGVAKITSTGLYQFGSKTAQRKITQFVAQATTSNLVDTAAIFSSPATGTDNTGDLEFSTANLTILNGGSLVSGRDLSINQNSHIAVDHIIQYARHLKNTGASTVSCNSNPTACDFTQNNVIPTMPMINFDSYETLAKTHLPPQYFDKQADFFSSFPPNSTKTFDGVVFINGKLDLDQGRTLIINGVLVSNDTINVGSNSTNGTLIMQDPGNKICGVLVDQKLEINSKGSFFGTGLIWTGLAVDFNSSINNIDIIGGVLGRRMYINNRTVTIHFDSNVINKTLADPTDSPIIKFNHWEEEY